MTAHVTFANGGLVLPDHTPYERQILQDYVLDQARHTDGLRIKVGRTLWLVERPGDDHPVVCARCRRPLKVAALHTSGSKATYCAACALH
jgi:hypothetical protein